MAPSGPDQSVHHLIGLADAPARLIGGPAQALESTHDDGRQAALGAGNQADTRRVKSGVKRREHLSKAVEACARFINQATGQYLREIQCRELNASGNAGLVSRQLRSLAGIQREGLVAITKHVTAAQVEPVAETVIDLYQEIVAVYEVWKAIRIVGPGSGNVL